MIKKLEEYLSNLNVFNKNNPKIVDKLLETIPNDIPIKMKLLLITSEIIRYSSQFNIKIKHWNNSIIPINSICFLIAESGANKDSSFNYIRKNFDKSYELINKIRNKKAIDLAISKATELNMENPTNYHVYNQFYKSPNSLLISTSTQEGLIQYLNDIDELQIGSVCIFSSELGAELNNNINIIDNIKILSEMFDEGNKSVKILKDRTSQNKELKNISLSALFMGSQDNILYNESIKTKFKTEFTTKLARRCFFVFVNQAIKQKEYDNINEFLEYEKNKNNKAINNNDKINEYLLALTKKYINNNKINTLIEIDEDTKNLILLYKKYNELLAEQIDSLSIMTKLTRQHLHWKTLKLAGALAIIQDKPIIDLECYSYAITFTESIFNDINIFEQELTKESYEIFVSYVNNYCINNKLFLSIHDIKKKGFINNKGDLNKKIEELSKLASIYDNEGLYRIKENGILFEKLEKSNLIGISILKNTGTKEERVKHSSVGYEYIEGKFEKLTNVLKDNYSYTPYKFKDGIRNKNNIIQGIKWIVLDVDKTTISDYEAHLMLEDIKHIIVRTSNPNNEFKYRILIELDGILNIDSYYWNRLLKSISNFIGIDIDLCPQSQTFLSYKESYNSILTNFSGELFKIKPHIEYALSMDNKQIKLEDDLANKFKTFKYAYESKNGEGSRNLYKAAKHAKDIGMNKTDIVELIRDINNYWIIPMDTERLDRTIIKQIESWIF